MANAMIKMSKNTFFGIVDAVKQKRGLDSVAVTDLRDEILSISGDTFKFLVTADYPKASLARIEEGEHLPIVTMSLDLDDEESDVEND